MKILIVRHGDPDYSIDSLTEKGWKEAEYLSERLTKMDISKFYVSPLGRAQDTISFTLKKLNRTAEVLDWLREFKAPIHRPDVKDQKKVTWDWLPQDWMNESCFYEKNEWYNHEIMKEGNVKEQYEWVTENFDLLLEKHGYKRDEKYYRVVNPNNDTICLVCHFGLESVLLSHLMNISPMIIWHHTCAAPTSVTTIVTEERREGIASFRMSAFGDISHLYAKDEPPAFAARFCECYTNTDERH
ncbi:MAG: histidine phosphatase family protein [Schaedlerella sp.]|nr:histidine phosphatase family protein [Schaedlerella sp.]